LLVQATPAQLAPGTPGPACAGGAGEMAPTQRAALEIHVVSAFSGHELCTVEAASDWTVLNTKAQIEQQLGIPVYMQHLMAGSAMLCDSSSLKQAFDGQQPGASCTVRLVKSATGLVRPDYMEDQVDINSKMRAILVDWLVKVHFWSKFRQETLFLTVALLDRYVSQHRVARRAFQLTGVTAMLIAAKFEEVNVPRVSDIVYVCDQVYTPKQVLAAERSMLVALDFRAHSPTAAHFFVSPEAGLEEECWGHVRFARYLAELALHDTAMLRYAPSDVAFAAHVLSTEVLGPWPSGTEAGGQPPELRQAPDDCMETLRDLMTAAPHSDLQTSRNKLMNCLPTAQRTTLTQMGI